MRKLVKRKRMSDDGIEIIVARKNNIGKYKKIIFGIIILIICCIITTMCFIHRNEQNSLAFKIKCIEKYYSDRNIENYYNTIKLINKINNRSLDKTQYFNVFYDDNESNGDLFYIENDKAILINNDSSLNAVRKYAKKENYDVINISIISRDELKLNMLMEYEFYDIPLTKEIQCYIPTGEIISIGKTETKEKY